MQSEIKKISINDKEYPENLKRIKDSPKTLYYQGKVPASENCFAVIGTRRYSSYGKEAALQIAGDLAEAGLTIVSGLAPGIDTFAHQAALERKGRTIAVLGTGLDEKSLYPKENIKLAQKIVESGGCLISEYPPGTEGTQFTFPQRNRIISGLSIGVLVIEARSPLPTFKHGGKSGSGALITANFAEKEERLVFAVPGSIYSSNSKGCHYLIKNGAKLVENANDILKILNLSGLKSDFKLEAKGVSKEENLILETLKEGNLDLDKIIEKTKLSPAKTASTLIILETKGKIRNLRNNIYAITNR